MECTGTSQSGELLTLQDLGKQEDGMITSAQREVSAKLEATALLEGYSQPIALTSEEAGQTNTQTPLLLPSPPPLLGDSDRDKWESRERCFQSASPGEKGLQRQSRVITR